MRKGYGVAAFVIAAGLSANAQADIVVGPGFGTSCAQGSCPLDGGAVNAIGAHSLDLYQTSATNVDTSALLLILAVPNGTLSANPVTDAQLHVPSSNSASTPVMVGPLSAPTTFSSHELYGTLGFMLSGNFIVFNQLVSADYALFPAIFSASSNPIASFSLYEIQLTTPTTPFGGHDLINVDFTSLPVGTFALGYATPSLTVTDTPFEQVGVAGVAVPEPSALALLLGFAGLGLATTKRRA